MKTRTLTTLSALVFIFIGLTSLKNDDKTIKKEFFVDNSTAVSLPIEEIDQTHIFETNSNGAGFRCVTTRAPQATDFGPYSELYLIYDNAYEMPHRSAVFKIGSLHHFKSFKKLSESKYEIIGYMFNRKDLFIDQGVKITIDASNVLQEEKRHDVENTDYEGSMTSKIMVTVEEGVKRD